MSKKNKEEDWAKWLIVGALSFIVFFIIGSSLNLNRDSPYENTKEEGVDNYNYDNNYDNLQTETISISGIGETTTITNQNKLIVSISGVENVVSFSKQSNPQEILLSGIENTVYLCEGIHNPTIQKSGVDTSVIYINC